MTSRIAVVAGGAGSIGGTIARRLSKEGFSVAILDVNGQRGEELIGELGPSARYLSCDVTDMDAVRRAIHDIEADSGAIEVLVNAVGGNTILGFPKRLYWEIDSAERETLLQLNLYSALNACYAVLPLMIKQRHGNIVNITSGQGLSGGKGLATYSAAKGGIKTFTQALAGEAGPYGVRVNSIAPGSTQTAFRVNETPEDRAEVEAAIPLRRRTSPEDVAAAVAFLVSEEASHITGACLNLSGGTHIY